MTYLNLQTYFFIALLFGIGVLTGVLLWPYFSALALAATIAVIFYPLYRRLLTASGNRETVAAFVTTAIIVILVFVPLVFFGFQIFQEARALYVTLSTNHFTLPVFLTDLAGGPLQQNFPGLSFNVSTYTRQFLSWVLQNIGQAFASITQLVISFFISLLALYYLLKDGHRIRRAIIAFSPLLDRYDKKIFSRLHAAVTSVVKGSLAIALMQGFSASLGLWLCGVPSPALWGSIAVIAALIPTFGTSLVILPAVAYLFVTGHPVASMILLVWGITAVGLLDNLIRPKLLERDLRIHPLLILLAVLGGLSLFGPIGFVVGPLTLSLFFALLDIYPALLPVPATPPTLLNNHRQDS